ncbi:hypothetical protein GJR99_02465 [Haloferax sp. MBLA0078]|uniref:Uncharacterized protein n=1 Tax=Haloferax marinum TaxID=2666143 RepID=A0A6A8G3T9_9EURY|nr:hypothetical protein [Haloferax sp. CBA1150]KAB1196441.1 hypothetical protein Hfx1150_02465 [Haloferax sp. CBA1150]MRW95437.1 hypothetical protein [Haloferax marinum]
MQQWCVVNAAWRRKVQREVDALTGGPLSAGWWFTKAGLRVVFAEVIFMFLVIMNNDADAIMAVNAGEASVLSIFALVLTTPDYLVIAAIVFLVAFLLPFLPRRNEATNRWE